VGVRVTPASRRDPPDRICKPATGVAVAANWTAWLLLLNLAWEVAQLPLYAFGPDVPALCVAFYVAHCTVGDGVIAAGAYAVAALVTRDAAWPRNAAARGTLITCVSAVAYTAWSEWRNVYVLANWAYAASMPTVAGIGLSPLAQWALLPVLPTLLMRRRRRSFREPD